MRIKFRYRFNDEEGSEITAIVEATNVYFDEDGMNIEEPASETTYVCREMELSRYEEFATELFSNGSADLSGYVFEEIMWPSSLDAKTIRTPEKEVSVPVRSIAILISLTALCVSVISFVTNIL